MSFISSSIGLSNGCRTFPTVHHLLSSPIPTILLSPNATSLDPEDRCHTVDYSSDSSVEFASIRTDLLFQRIEHNKRGTITSSFFCTWILFFLQQRSFLSLQHSFFVVHLQYVWGMIILDCQCPRNQRKPPRPKRHQLKLKRVLRSTTFSKRKFVFFLLRFQLDAFQGLDVSRLSTEDIIARTRLLDNEIRVGFTDRSTFPIDHRTFRLWKMISFGFHTRINRWKIASRRTKRKSKWIKHCRI